MVILVRVKDGVLKRGQRIRMMANKTSHHVEQVGVFTPKMLPMDELGPGEMGYITAAIKTVADCNVGDTITDERVPAAEALAGFKPSIPVVWCGLFPVDADDFEHLRDSLAKLRLNDASFHFEAESSAALGFGYRCGFLGLLHLEIIQERLTREFNLDLIATAPSVVYRLLNTRGVESELHNPADMPDPSQIDHIQEPWIKATIMVPDEYLGSILTLCSERRGQQVGPHLCRHPRHGGLSPAVERGGVRLLRPAQERQPRLRQLRLRDRRLRGRRPRAHQHPREPGPGGRAELHRPSQRGRKPGAQHLREAEGADPEAAVQDRDPGGDRRPGDRAGDDQRA